VLAATAAGRRTESAFPRFVAAHGFDVIVYDNRPEAKIATLPEVASATELAFAINGQPTCNCTHPINGTDLSVGVVSSKGEPPFKLVSGRLPDQSAPDQVLASFTLQQDDGVQPGTVIHVPLYAASQASALNTGALPTPKGPTVALHVVGIEATEDEFPSGGTPIYNLYGTQAFARSVLPRTAPYYQYFVHLRHGVADLPRFEQTIDPLQLGSYSSEDAQATSIEASIHPQAIGWWILAALAALVGLAVVGQALARQSIVESEDYPTLASLGVDRRQLAALGMARNVMVGLAGGAGALVVATALSTAIRGPLLFSTVDGHLPNGDNQIVLGAATMRQAGAHLGSIVQITVSGPSGRTRTASFRVVSQVSFPELEGTVSLGTGALTTNAGIEDALICPAGPGRAACLREHTGGSGILANVVSGPRGQAAVNHYLAAYSTLAISPVTPTSLVNFGEAVNFPLIFGAMLAVFGAATLTHLLVVSVSRRRREIGLLKVLGFVNRQVAAVVAWQATTLALVGIVIGVPLGLVAGQAIWRAFANNLGAVPVSVVPIWLVGLLVAGVIVFANLIAIGPALVARRSKPATLLRTQ